MGGFILFFHFRERNFLAVICYCLFSLEDIFTRDQSQFLVHVYRFYEHFHPFDLGKSLKI